MTPDEYLGRVQALLWQVAEYVPWERLANARSLIEHGEPVIGLVSLAWILVNEGVTVPANVVTAIREYTDGWDEAKFLPPNLDQIVAHDS